MENISPQMQELLNELTREELIQINRAVIRRIKLMDDLKRFKENSAFYPGDKVSWNDQEGATHFGRVLRVNTKTISVEEDGDPEGIWRIPAILLTKQA